MKTAACALSDDRGVGHRDRAERLARLQAGHDLRDVRYQALREIPHLGAGIGDDLFALAVVKFLRDFQRLAGRPAEARAAQFLQRGQIVELRRSLPLVFDAHAQRALEALNRFDHLLGDLASDNSLLRGVPHLELTTSYVRGGDNLKIRLRHKVPDFELALADDRQGWRLNPANAYDAPRTLTKNDGRGSGQRQVVDLVGLSARDGGGVKRSVFGVWLRPAESVADRLRILRGEQHPHDLAAVIVMLENLLTDELPLAIAIGGEPYPLCGAQRLTDCPELRGFVAALGRAGAIKAFGTKQDRRPALPGRHDILGFEKIQQMSLGREDVPVARPHGGANVFRLAGLLGDDDLIRHIALVQGTVAGMRSRKNI